MGSSTACSYKHKVEDMLFCDIRGVGKPQGAITRKVILSPAIGMFNPSVFKLSFCPKLLPQES